MKAKISEIFHSLQGEGKYTGREQVFVRFLGCNIHCAWCDTPDSLNSDAASRCREYNLEELTAEIKELWADCHAVSLTGGEPLMQKDFIKILLPELKKQGMKSYLETNGILAQNLVEIIEDIDIVAMDFKLPSSTKCRPFWREHEEFLKIAKQREVFVKAVVSCDTKKIDIINSVELIAAIDHNIPFILQPNYIDRNKGALDLCLDFQDYCKEHLTEVKIMPQMHKIWNIR